MIVSMPDADSADLQVRLLGSIEVVSSDAVALGGPTQRRILAILLLRRGSVVSVDSLADATWSTTQPSRAAHNIQSYVHRLRSAFPKNALSIETLNPGYRLTVGSAVVDADLFETHVNTSRRLLAQGRSGEALDECEFALSLWHGSPFGDLGSESWARAEVTRLAEIWNSAHELRAELMLLSGSPSRAVIELEAITTEYPFREQPRILLIRALHASGRTTDALRAFQQYRKHLIDEVGVEPSAELVELDQAIARGEVAEGALPVVAGGYEVHERIGEGASAVVHRATHRVLEREVAIKIIRAELANRPAFIRGFEHEARIVARLDHPNVVPLFDYWRDPDQAFLVMGLMVGGSLSDRMRSGPFSLAHTLILIDEVASGLSAAHSLGLIHRDVKPANILFDGAGRAVLADFGIAINQTDAEADLSVCSGSSIHFAAPEQLDGGEVGVHTDVYGLATVAYAALTGTTPFGDLDGAASLQPAKRARGLSDLPATLNLSAVGNFLTISTDPTASNRPSSVQAFADGLRAAADGSVPSVLGDSEPETPPNPYQGLRAFDEGVAVHFHGRDNLVGELIRSLGKSNLLAVVGASGSGKSSVIRAGLLPAIGDGALAGSHTWFTSFMSPGGHPYEALEAALLRVAVNPPDALLAQLQDGPRGMLRSIKRVLPGEDAILLLVIDQFEELFTNSEDPATTERFLSDLTVALAEFKTPLRLVMTLRADFLDRPLRHHSFAQLMRNGLVTVPPLAPEELEQVIVAPAKAVGVSFENGLVAHITDDSSRRASVLPLLQYALTRSFDQSDGQTIRRADYDAVGGIEGSLSQRAEELFLSLSPDHQAALRRIMGHLVALGEGSEDTRRVASRTELGEGAITQQVLIHYGKARLITFDRDRSTREPTVEVAHEALIRTWQRLSEWLDEDRDDLRTARHLQRVVKDWEWAGRPDSELFRGGRLATAETWASTHPDEPSGPERAFVSASIRLRDAEAQAQQNRFDEQERSNRRLRRLLAGVAILLAVALVAGVVAVRERGSARQAAFDAETARLVATAESLATSNPRAAMLVALAAVERGESPAALGALQFTLSKAPPFIGTMGWGNWYEEVVWLVNDRVVAGGFDGVRLFDAKTGALLDSIESPNLFQGQKIQAAEEAPVIAVSSGNSLKIYEVHDGFDLIDERELPLLVVSAALNASGTAVAAVDAADIIRSWTIGGNELFELDLEDPATVYRQALPYLGPGFPTSETLRGIPVRSSVQPLGGELFVATGAFLRHVSWSGDVLAETYVTYEREPGERVPALLDTISRTASGAFLISAPNSIGWLPPSDQWSSESDIDVIPEFVAEGTPDIALSTHWTETEQLLVLTDGSVNLLNLKTGERTVLANVGIGGNRSMALNRDRDVAALSTGEGITLIALAGQRLIAEALPKPDQATSLSISADARFISLGPRSENGTIAVWERPTGDHWQLVRSLELVGFSAKFVHHRDESLLQVLRSNESDSVESQLISFSDLGSVSVLPWEEAASAYSVAGAFSQVADQPLLALATENMDIWTYPSFDHRAQIDLPCCRPERSIGSIAFNPDGTMLLVSVRQGSSLLLETNEWSEVNNDVVSRFDIAAGYWNAAGDLMAVASGGGKIAILDGDTFEVVTVMNGGGTPVSDWSSGALLFSEDDRLLLSSFGSTSRLWDVATGEPIGPEFEASPSSTNGANYGDSLRLVTGTDEHALVWNLDVDSWPSIVCQTARSSLSEREWDEWGPADESFRSICPDFPYVSRQFVEDTEPED